MKTSWTEKNHNLGHAYVMILQDNSNHGNYVPTYINPERMKTRAKENNRREAIQSQSYFQTSWEKNPIDKLYNAQKLQRH